jgi:hypothetical protein
VAPSAAEQPQAGGHFAQRQKRLVGNVVLVTPAGQIVGGEQEVRFGGDQTVAGAVADEDGASAAPRRLAQDRRLTGPAPATGTGGVLVGEREGAGGPVHRGRHHRYADRGTHVGGHEAETVGDDADLGPLVLQGFDQKFEMGVDGDFGPHGAQAVLVVGGQEGPLAESAFPAPDLALVVEVFDLVPGVTHQPVEEMDAGVGHGDGAVEVEEDRGGREIDVVHQAPNTALNSSGTTASSWS